MENNDYDFFEDFGTNTEEKPFEGMAPVREQPPVPQNDTTSTVLNVLTAIIYPLLCLAVSLGLGLNAGVAPWQLILAVVLNGVFVVTVILSGVYLIIIPLPIVYLFRYGLKPFSKYGTGIRVLLAIIGFICGVCSIFVVALFL